MARTHVQEDDLASERGTVESSSLQDRLQSLVTAELDPDLRELEQAFARANTGNLVLGKDLPLVRHDAYLRMLKDYQRCRVILSANFESLVAITVDNIKDRDTALTASATYTPAFFNSLALDATHLKRLITMARRKMQMYGATMSPDMARFQASL